MKVIEVENLQKTYRYYRKSSGLMASICNLWQRQWEYKTIVNDISFSVARGEAVAFLGPNGAGKTTTMKMLSGILHPSAGEATVLGHTPWLREKAFKQRFAILMGQKQQLWPDLPAGDSFELCRHIYEIPQQIYRQRVAELSELLAISHLLDIQVRRLSLGERMKMELIAALLHGPELLFLDEPTIGLDFEAQRAINSFLKKQVAEQQLTVILTSHNMADITSLCERVIVIQNGGLIFDDAISNLQPQLGACRRIQIESEQPMQRDVLSQLGQVLAFQTYCAEIEVMEYEVNSVLQRLLRYVDVKDIKVMAQPLELSLQQLYLNARKIA
ncbi:ATP-binding cassette domain-containing protein [Pseudoalteromonas fenneropenaei]|uniref:ATP-binding cassette domain-containing protein n=1 Tax=Pseudoalteromonas fenneropenaei TaxID=1737459 RepID=A0ABV7CJS6_9GAMM